MRYLVITLVLFLLNIEKSEAQAFKFTKHKRYLSVGGSLNFMNYFGDIAPKNKRGSTDFGRLRPNFTAYASKRLLPFVSARAQFSMGAISGYDKERFPDRNVEFTTFITEFALIGMFDIFPNYGAYYKRPKLPIPYVLVGAAAYTAILDFKDDARGDELMKEPPPFSAAIPVGFGVRYKVSSHVDVGVEWSYRITFSDRLDGTIATNPNPEVLPDEINSDHYMIMGFHVNYIFSGGVRSPRRR